MNRLLVPFVLIFLWLSSCAPSGKDLFAGWDTYEAPDGRFSLRYLSPPWTECNETEYEDDCHECPGHLIGDGRCGGANNWIVLWIPPALLDPDFLLIPPFKFEISWFPGDFAPLELAQGEESLLVAQGLEVVIPSRLVTLNDGTVGAEVGYRGPVHLVVNETALNRPDEREYLVVYLSSGGSVHRLAVDTAIDISLPEVRDMVDSFTTGGEAP